MTGKGETVRNSGLIEGTRNSGLVQGTQEDIDFVIAAENHLIMGEAKAYNSFDSVQFGRKMKRLGELYKFYKELEPKSPLTVQFDFVFYSPTEPAELESQVLPWDRELFYLELAIPYPSVVRRKFCNVVAWGGMGQSADVKKDVSAPERRDAKTSLLNR